MKPNRRGRKGRREKTEKGYGTVLQNDLVKNDQQPDSQVGQSQMRDVLIGDSNANSVSPTFSAPSAISAVHFRKPDGNLFVARIRTSNRKIRVLSVFHPWLNSLQVRHLL
jgi:hypothetical protein